MVGLPGGLSQLLQEALGWLGVILQITGFVICLRYVRLSSAMPLLVLAFAGFVGGGIGSRLFLFAIRREILPGEGAAAISLALTALDFGATAMLIVGLLLVFRDIRERFHFLREVHSGSRSPERRNEAGPSATG
ncbi:MAG TPA: hypothetical protein VL475_02710 [Planctomycetaceae bacterium]|jgi:hypothetical protein|nr:hypothetical protein [Planctomycetaceae bacterium]